MRTMSVVTVGFVLFLTAGQVQAADPIVYPAQQQTPEQQAKDRQECHQWAVAQSGYDPSAAGSTAGAQAPKKDRTVLKTAVKGAAVGGLGGSLGGEFGKGAAAGAAVGGLAGAIRKHKQPAQAASANAQLQETFNRAYGLCLESRGYTVK